jgi:hypothetical protein
VQLEGFLARVIPATGNYLIISYNKEPTKKNPRAWGSRSYPASAIDDAAGLVRWAVSKGFDVYHALAAFTAGEVKTSRDGKQYFQVKREQANAQLLKTLVIDADVARPGDGKNPATVFATRGNAVRWMLDFTVATGLPRPNLAVSSGYGIHFYWVLEEELPVGVWQPLADAMKAAMLAHQWVGDTSITIDAARILRPPETHNWKSGTATPVTVLPRFNAGDYPVAMIERALAPYVGIQVQQRATGTHGPLPGGATVHPIGSLGPRPTHVNGGSHLNQNAHAGLPQRPYSFKAIAGRCAQVNQSLASHGNGDPYQLWYLGHLTLAAFCTDGDDFVHPISDGDLRYNQANVDAHYAQAKTEIARKGLGAPTCAEYDNHRAGVCQGCPFYTKLVSPISLGIDDGDLPEGYRRATTPERIERLVFHGKGDAEWEQLVTGNAHTAVLDELKLGGHAITFTYEKAGKQRCMSLADFEAEPRHIQGLLCRQGMSVDRHNAANVGDFLVAWINKLRDAHAERLSQIKPFGWAWNADAERIGLAVAGTHYRRDGTEERITGGDPMINAAYTPSGTFAGWRAGAALFEGANARPDLQALIATSFGAPLIALAGDVRGMSFNFWSTESGIGKSSAIRIGQSIWGDFKLLQAMKDTPNSVMRSLSIPRFLVRYWDELQVPKEWRQSFCDLIFSMPVGREKSRLTSEIVLRESGEWETMLVFTSNRSCADYLLDNNQATDAGVLRLFECPMIKIKLPLDPKVGLLLKSTETNYGHAGRMYAQWLAVNMQVAIDTVARMMSSLIVNLNAQQEERFYIAGMACTLVGAIFAKRLGLFDFDVKAMEAYLRVCFLAMRAARGAQTLVASAGGYDLEEVFSQYLYDQADYTLHTKTLARQGVNKVDVIYSPRWNTVKAQIAEVPAVARLSRQLFQEWLSLRNLPARTIVAQMTKQWNAVETRASLGSGTPFKGGQIWVVDVPLVGSLTAHLPAQSLAIQTTPKPAPVPGNQPRI